MFSFYTYFFENDVFINTKNKYAANEILTAYLNSDFIDEADDLLDELKHLKKHLRIFKQMDFNDYKAYNSRVYNANACITKINEYLSKLPPYNEILRFPIDDFLDFLNAHPVFFEDGLDPYHEEEITWETTTPYGVGEEDEDGFYHLKLFKFELTPPEELCEHFAGSEQIFDEFNADLENYFNKYITFLKGYLSVHEIFKQFIKEYLHRKNTFLESFELARAFEDFTEEHIKNFENFPCSMQSFGYKVIENEKHKPMLCETMQFKDLQSFLFYDFFRGINRNYIPNECQNCHKFFLIRGGKYFNFCDRVLPEDKTKTCRDVGSKRKYDDKCKNDPIWQTYNRAYKAHYARYMKKKMTSAEFEKWSSFASEIRDKAIKEEIEFEDYYKEIRK